VALDYPSKETQAEQKPTLLTQDNLRLSESQSLFSLKSTENFIELSKMKA